MNLEMMNYIEEIRTEIGGLQCLRQFLEITDNTSDELSYAQLAGMIGVFALALDTHVMMLEELAMANASAD